MLLGSGKPGALWWRAHDPTKDKRMRMDVDQDISRFVTNHNTQCFGTVNLYEEKLLIVPQYYVCCHDLSLTELALSAV